MDCCCQLKIPSMKNLPGLFSSFTINGDPETPAEKQDCAVTSLAQTVAGGWYVSEGNSISSPKVCAKVGSIQCTRMFKTTCELLYDYE